MYYSYYLNEKLLLDEWSYYQKKGECNWLLKRTLMNDDRKTSEEKIRFYFENRRVVNHYSDYFKEQAEQVREMMWMERADFESEAEYEYYLDHKYIHDDYEIMDYGRNQKLLNMYRRYINLEDHANDRTLRQLRFEPKEGFRLREHELIRLNKSDIKFIRRARKYTTLTVPQIEVLFGIIFFCRMNGTKEAQLNTDFKRKQFMSCFDLATFEDLDYVVKNVSGIELVDGDIFYAGFDAMEDWIEIAVTKQNNKLNLTKMTKKYITDLKDKRYCEMCLSPFEPTNNRQKVCPECKAKADEIKAKMRKTKQRFVEKNGKEACCGKCTDCIRTDCNNWWQYWKNELDKRTGEDKMDQLLNDIQNVYTKEQKSEIKPWDILHTYDKFRL